MDNQQSNDESLRELALFAGAGGGILGGKLLGWETVCAVENEPYPASVLVARQNEGFLPPFPIWDDVRTFDGRPWKGIVDVVSGGFPCQDISSAGKGKGLEGARSGLWFEFLRIINEIQPRFVFIENSPLLRTRGLNVVLQGLAESGYDAAWGVLSASDCGANHQRKRMWIVGKLADANNSGSLQDSSKGQLWTEGLEQSSENSRRSNERKGNQVWKTNWWEKDPADLSNTNSNGGSGLRLEMGESSETGQGRENTEKDGDTTNGGDSGNRKGTTESYVGRVADGVAARVDRLKAIGNGQVPLVAAIAFQQLYKILMETQYDKA